MTRNIFLYCELYDYDDIFASFGYMLIYSRKGVKIYYSLITLFCHFFIMIQEISKPGCERLYITKVPNNINK